MDKNLTYSHKTACLIAREKQNIQAIHHLNSFFQVYRIICALNVDTSDHRSRKCPNKENKIKAYAEI
jgi:hypothetical protein